MELAVFYSAVSYIYAAPLQIDGVNEGRLEHPRCHNQTVTEISKCRPQRPRGIQVALMVLTLVAVPTAVSNSHSVPYVTTMMLTSVVACRQAVPVKTLMKVIVAAAFIPAM